MTDGCSDNSVTPGSVLSANWASDPETNYLYCNLADLDNKLLWGVQDSTGSANPNTDQEVYNLSGEWPGLMEMSYTGDFPDDPNNGADVQAAVENEYSEGGVAAIDWTPLDPTNGESPWQDTDSKDVCSWITPGGSHYNEIIPGTDTNPSQNFLQELESLGAELNGMYIPGTDTPIPVLLRIMPEMDGDWFWWGSGSPKGNSALNGHCGAAEYQALYQYVVNTLSTLSTLSTTQNPLEDVDNALTVYAPSGGTGKFKNGSAFEAMMAQFYPGNSYVDVIADGDYDKTRDGKVMSLQSDVMGSLAATVSFAAEKKKMPAMAEGENSTANAITGYWKQYFCSFAFDGDCGSAPGNTALTAIRYAMVWFNTATKQFAPTTKGFVTALEQTTYTNSAGNFTIAMASQGQSADPWYCPNMTC
jgi:Glycosyl hydrolase family 26